MTDAVATDDSILPTSRREETVRAVPFDDHVAAAWDQFVVSHPSGSLFHQTGWKRVIERTFGFEPAYLYTENNGRVTGIAPLFKVSNWIVGNCLISVPFGVYGGICADDAESENVLLEQIRHMAEAQKVDYLELRSRSGGVRSGFHRNPRYATFTMPIHADVGALFNSLPKDIRYMVRKAQKAGLATRRGFDQLDTFYQLFAINMKRLGTPVFPKMLMENLIRELPGQVDVMVVYAGSRPVAGALSFLFRNSLQPYYVGSSKEARPVAGNDFMWWELVRYAAESGKTCFDFGRSKVGTGACAFKMKWKPQIENLDYQVYLVRRKTVPNFSPSNPKFELAANVWKHLPLPLTRILGAPFVRLFP